MTSAVQIFGINTNSLNVNPEHHALISVHKKAIKLILKQGVLIFNRSDDYALTIQEKINKLPPKINQKWTFAISNARRIETDCNVIKKTSIFEDTDEMQELDDRCNYLMIDDENLSLLNIKDASFTTNKRNSITSFDRLFNIESIEDSLHIANASISIDECRDAIWNTRFKHIIPLSKSIIITDRYIIKNTVEQWQKNIATNKRELYYIFSRISSENTTTSITIYSSISTLDINFALDDITNALNEIITTGRFSFRRITIIISPDSCFAKNSHDRYIRFDKFHAFYFGAGLSVFRNSRASVNSTFSITSLAECDFLSIEDTLKQNQAIRRISLTY